MPEDDAKELTTGKVNGEEMSSKLLMSSDDRIHCLTNDLKYEKMNFEECNNNHIETYNTNDNYFNAYGQCKQIV